MTVVSSFLFVTKTNSCYVVLYLLSHSNQRMSFILNVHHHLVTDTHYDQLNDFKKQQCKVNDGTSNDFCYFALTSHCFYYCNVNLWTILFIYKREFLSTCTYICYQWWFLFIMMQASSARWNNSKKTGFMASQFG